MFEKYFNKEILISQGILSLNFGLIKLLGKRIPANSIILFKSIINIFFNLLTKDKLNSNTFTFFTLKTNSIFDRKYIYVYFSTVFLICSLKSLKFSNFITLTIFNPFLFVFDNYLKKKNSDKNIILLGLVGIGCYLLLYFDSKLGSFYMILHLLFTYYLTKSQINSNNNNNIKNSNNKNYASYFYNIFFSLLFGIIFNGIKIRFKIILICLISLFLNVILGFYNKIITNQKNKKNLFYNTILIIFINMFFNNIFFNELNNIFDVIGTCLIFSIYYYDDLVKKLKTK